MNLGHITAVTLSCPCLFSAWRCGRSFTTPPGDRDKSGQGILRLPGTCSSPNGNLSSRHCHLKKERGPRTHKLAHPSGASSRKPAQIDPLRSPQPRHHLCFARAPTTETFCGLCRARLCCLVPGGTLSSEVGDFSSATRPGMWAQKRSAACLSYGENETQQTEGRE